MKTKIMLLGMMIAIALSTNAQTKKEIEQKIQSIDEQIKVLHLKKAALELSLGNNLAKYETIQTNLFFSNRFGCEKVSFEISDSLSYVTLIIKDKDQKITKTINEYIGGFFELSETDCYQYIEVISPDGKPLKIKNKLEL